MTITKASGTRRRGGTSTIPIGFASITRIGGETSTIITIGARRDGGGSITPDWCRQNHPDWWGDFDDQRIWRPAGWWWQNRPDWVRDNHPDWWGDFDDHKVWRPASYWWATKPDWVRENHPNWWGDFDDKHVWHTDTWWHHHDAAWASQHHPEWKGDYDDKHVWHDVHWWAQKESRRWPCSVIPIGMTRCASR